MKLKTVSGKTLGTAVPMVLGAVGGAMVGRGLTAVISKPAGATPTQAELNKKTIVQGIMAVGGFVGHTAIDGNDAIANATRGALLGIAIDNTIAVVGTLVSKSATITQKLSADTKLNTFAKASLGLACPGCESTYAPLNRPRRRMLGYPTVESGMLVLQEASLFN